VGRNKQQKDESRAFTRREFLKTGAIAAAGMALPTACSSLVGPLKNRAAKRPNLILIFTDDHAAEAIGYASNGLVKTPNLDRLARNGAIFRHGYCSAMTCCPARVAMLSGLDYNRAEKGPGWGFVLSLKEGAWTWAHALRAGGYRTGQIGKVHSAPTWANHGFDTLLINQQTGFNAPKEIDEKAGGVRLNQYQEFLKAHGTYDYFDGYGIHFPPDQQDQAKAYRESYSAKGWPQDPKLHRLSWMRDRAIEFIEKSKSDPRPFVLALTPSSPHAPYVPAKEFLPLYDPEQIVLPTDQWEDMEDMPDALKRYSPAVNAKGQKDGAHRDNHSAKELRESIALYRAVVSHIDAMVGEIVKHVDLENTLIIFTGDQGDYQGRRGRVGKTPWIPFEELGRVPFFATGWKVPKGEVLDAPVVHVDFAPTFLQAAGLPIPDGLDGVPLQRYFENPNYGKDRAVYCIGYMGGDMVAWRNLRYINCGGKAPMLFDLDSDPGEIKNLANKPAWQKQLAMMQRKWRELKNRPAPSLPHFPKIPMASSHHTDSQESAAFAPKGASKR
jgi:arylsulfatase A-like enzyme